MTKNGLVLIIDDDPHIFKLLNRRLSDAGYEVVSAESARSGLEQAGRLRPDLILLDFSMPDMDGDATKIKLNESKVTADIPVIFLTAKNTTPDKIKGLSLGADDYITKPFDIEELKARIERAVSRRQQYESLALTDPLTGLANRRLFEREFHTFYRIAKRYGRLFSLMVIDLDKFKSINDTHGHAAGDLVLKNFAEIMKQLFRASDIIARYGGDEFAVLLSETDEEQAAVAAKRLHGAVQVAKVVVEGEPLSISYSVSVGLVVYRNDFADESEMFKQADAKMYQAKCQKQSEKI